MDEEKTAAAAEINAYKSTIEELEGRIFEAKMTKNPRSRSQSIDDIAKNDIAVEMGSQESSIAVTTSGLGDTISDGLSLETLREESIQLKSLLEGEISSLETSLNDREEEARSAARLAAEYAQKYALLKDEFDSQIQRLVLKLSLEQQARADVEERIESVSVGHIMIIKHGLDLLTNYYFSKIFGLLSKLTPARPKMNWILLFRAIVVEVGQQLERTRAGFSVIFLATMIALSLMDKVALVCFYHHCLHREFEHICIFISFL